MSNFSFSEYNSEYLSDYYKQEFPPSQPPPSHFPILDIAGNDVSELFKNIYLEEETIDNDKCNICGYDLETVVTIKTHKKCQKLKNKIDKLKIDLSNCEFKLFCLKTN